MMTVPTPSAATFGELVNDYIADQDAASLERLRAAVVSSPTFNPDLDLEAEFRQLVNDEQHQEVADALIATMPGSALNPTAHAMLGWALAALGHEQAAQREQVMARLSVSSVLSTGDGTRERPWSVLRVADEYALMRAQKVQPTGQTMYREGGRILDRHETADGGEVWFAVDGRS